MGKQAKILAGKYRIFQSDFVGEQDVVVPFTHCPNCRGRNLQKDTFIFPGICYTIYQVKFLEEIMENILALIVPVLIAIFVIKLLLSQVKLIWKLAVNSLSGFICLWLLNLASGLTGIEFDINFITTLVVGFLGIPGILLLLVFQFLR